MKKIFAFVLASIMVLSLVPASAFAAITKDCELPHTVDNCEHTKIDTVDATCKSAGYTIYECNACGEQFLADFKEKADHNWVSNEDEDEGREDVPVNCDKKEDGVTYLICDDCGEEYVKITEWETAHNLVAVPESGFGCEEQFECTICDGIYYGWDEDGHAKEESSHTWVFTEIVTEPALDGGEETKGEALYTCKVCKDTKIVPVFAPDCKCDGNQDLFCTRIKKAVSPTCEEAGTYAVYECEDCGQLWQYKSNKYTKISNVEKAVRKATGHTPVLDKNDKPVTTVKGCTTTYTCDNCDKTITEYAHDKDDKYIEWETYNEASCTDYGYSVWLCTYCGDGDAIITDPSGHKEVTVEVAPTCCEYGYTYTYCTNEYCTLKADYTYTKGGITYDVAVEDKDGKVLRVKVIALFRGAALDETKHEYEVVNTQQVSCGQAGYEVYKCKNCPKMYIESLPAREHVFDEDKFEYKAPDCINQGYYKVYCTVCEQYVELYTMAPTPGVHNYEILNEDYTCDTNSLFFNEKDGQYYYGKQIRVCTGCNNIDVKYVDPIATTTMPYYFEDAEKAYLYHTVLAGSEKTTLEAKCYRTGLETYTCADCGNTVYIIVDKADHDEDKSTFHKAKDATCSNTGNLAYYTCNECGADWMYDEDGKQFDATKADYTTNKHSATTTKKVEVKDCTGKVVYTYWECTGKKCGKKFTDETAATAYTGPTKDIGCQWKTVVNYEAANCNTEGVVGVQYCTVCNSFRLIENYIVNNDGEISIKKTTETFDTAAKAEEYTLVAGKKVEIEVDTNGTVTATTVKIAKFEHAYDKDSGEYLAIETEASMDESKWDCSKPYYDHNFCTLCEYEYLDSYKPASSDKGHVNRDGVLLTGTCADLSKIKDRTCYYCGTEVEVEHKLYSENGGEVIVVEPTCKTDGYVYDYCVVCGYIDIDEVYFADADEYHEATIYDDYYEEMVPLHGDLVGTFEDYANDGYYYWACDVCGKKISEVYEADCPGKGLELVLSTDAEYYTAGSSIFVTVSIDSLKGVDVWGLTFPVKYNPSCLEFVGYEFNTANGAFQNFVVNDVQACVAKYNFIDDTWTYDKEESSVGTIVVTANAPENVAIKGSQELVTLEFKVNSADYAWAFIEIPYEAMTQVAGKYEDGSPKYEWFYVDVVDEKGNAVDALYNGFASVDFEIKTFLDINDDGYRSMADALALYEYIVFDEHDDVVADANHDGQITVEDLDILYRLLSGVVTVEDLINPVTIEDIEYDEEGNAVLPDDFVPSDGAKD